MVVLRRVVPVLIVLAVIAVILGGLVALSRQLHELSARDVMTTRVFAAAFIVCDLVIGAALVTLLVIRDRRPPVWLERRLPFRGRWVWHFLLGLTILCYAGLAPTFLFLFVQMLQTGE
jgi:hypothetical protein